MPITSSFARKCIAFHYTSLENWWHIQDDGGMIPYKIVKPELAAAFSNLYGIWLWAFDLEGEEHVGSVLWQVMTKGTTKVVKLKIKYTEDMLIQRDNEIVSILHDGRLGNWVYHTSCPAIIAAVAIPIGKIQLIGKYDILSLGGIC